MKISKFIIPVFLLLGIFSCGKTKYETTTVKATYFDINTQQYVPNRKIYLFEAKKVTHIFGGYPTITGGVIKEVNTDASGTADFGEFEANKKNDYYYVVAIYSGINYSVPANVNKGANNTIPFTEYATADVTINFIQPPPYNAGDSLSVSFTDNNFSGTPFKITNSNYSQFSVVSLYSGYKYINIEKYKSGIYTNTNDTVFYSAFSTNEYNVYW